MQHIRFLVLEGEPLERLTITSILRQVETAQVHQADNGEQALQLLYECTGVDIAVCDLDSVGLEGLVFLSAASKAGLVRAVVISGEIAPTLKSATIAMIRCLGIHFLGELGPAPDLAKMQVFVDAFRAALPHHYSAGLPGVALPSACEIQRGLNEGEFEPYYQPKVLMQSGELKGAEVLARWNHPRLGVLPPSHFLSTMEANGLIEKLFAQLLNKGLALQQTLSRFIPPVELAFNVHAAQLASRTLVDQIEMTLDMYQLPANGVILEVTETALAGTAADSLENLIRLRLMGCGLAMDDFGTGYSSLKRLCDFPFSQLKLDGSFVRELQYRPESRAVIKNAVRLADSLHMSLVVEGVETTEQRDQLVLLGCSLGQGFGLARPMSTERFLQYCLEADHKESPYLISA